MTEVIERRRSPRNKPLKRITIHVTYCGWRRLVSPGFNTLVVDVSDVGVGLFSKNIEPKKKVKVELTLAAGDDEYVVWGVIRQVKVIQHGYSIGVELDLAQGVELKEAIEAVELIES